MREITIKACFNTEKHKVYVFGDRFTHCPFCGERLEHYEGRFRKDTYVSYKDLLDELKKQDGRNKFFKYFSMLGVVITSIALIFALYTETREGLLGIGLIALLITYIAIFIFMIKSLGEN